MRQDLAVSKVRMRVKATVRFTVKVIK